MHKSRLGALIVDCRSEDLFEDAQFWAAALGLKPESKEGQVNQKYVRLHGTTVDVPVILQKVEHAARVHLDIETDDIDAEVQRLEKLGAMIVEKREKWVVMEAPSKHKFCVISPLRSDLEENASEWE